MQDILVVVAITLIIGVAIFRFIKSFRKPNQKNGCGCKKCK
ncbi:MAG: FeoB-associated Cys-rich membrane protein [Rikenellaceae bacterium]